jgi:hypothetical protein
MELAVSIAGGLPAFADAIVTVTLLPPLPLHHVGTAPGGLERPSTAHQTSAAAAAAAAAAMHTHTAHAAASHPRLGPHRYDCLSCEPGEALQRLARTEPSCGWCVLLAWIVDDLCWHLWAPYCCP